MLCYSILFARRTLHDRESRSSYVIVFKWFCTFAMVLAGADTSAGYFRWFPHPCKWWGVGVHIHWRSCWDCWQQPVARVRLQTPDAKSSFQMEAQGEGCVRRWHHRHGHRLFSQRLYTFQNGSARGRRDFFSIRIRICSHFSVWFPAPSHSRAAVLLRLKSCCMQQQAWVSVVTHTTHCAYLWGSPQTNTLYLPPFHQVEAMRLLNASDPWRTWMGIHD